MKVLLIFLSLIVLFSCSNPGNEAEERAEIKKVLEDQRSSWNSGEIEKYMQGYWNSDSLSFISGRGVNRGWENTLIGYQNGYPDRASMGFLTFEIVELKRLSPEYYFMIGKWNLDRESDNPHGYFTLLWRKFDSGWKIISDHTS